MEGSRHTMVRCDGLQLPADRLVCALQDGPRWTMHPARIPIEAEATHKLAERGDHSSSLVQILSVRDDKHVPSRRGKVSSHTQRRAHRRWRIDDGAVSSAAHSHHEQASSSDGIARRAGLGGGEDTTSAEPPTGLVCPSDENPLNAHHTAVERLQCSICPAPPLRPGSVHAIAALLHNPYRLAVRADAVAWRALLHRRPGTSHTSASISTSRSVGIRPTT